MNRCFVCKELVLHMVSVSQYHAFAKMRSGPAGSYFKTKKKTGWGILLHKMCLLGKLALLNLVCLTTDLKRRHYWPFTLLSDVLLSLCLKKKKTKQNDKENLSLTVATTWQDNLLKSKPIQSRIVWSIRHQVTSLTVCVSPPPAPPVNWLISLDSVNRLVVVALCGHSSHFVRPRTELKFLVWIKTSWGIGLLAPQGGMLHFDRQAGWYEIWALCNLLRKDSQCVHRKRLVLLNEL